MSFLALQAKLWENPHNYTLKLKPSQGVATAGSSPACTRGRRFPQKRAGRLVRETRGQDGTRRGAETQSWISCLRHSQDTPTCTKVEDPNLGVKCKRPGNLHARPLGLQPDRKSIRTEGKEEKSGGRWRRAGEPTQSGWLIIITPLLQADWNDLLCPSLCDAPPLPLHQPEGTKNPKRPFDGWSALWMRAGFSTYASRRDSEAGFNLDP